MRFTKKEANFIDAARVARLATVDVEGMPCVVPVCPLLSGGRIYLGTEAAAKKVRNIAARPLVGIVFDDYLEAWDNLRGILVQGRARLAASRDFPGLRKKFYAKYHLYESVAPLDPSDSAIIEIEPERKLAWGF